MTNENVNSGITTTLFNDFKTTHTSYESNVNSHFDKESVLD